MLSDSRYIIALLNGILQLDGDTVIVVIRASPLSSSIKGLTGEVGSSAVQLSFLVLLWVEMNPTFQGGSVTSERTTTRQQTSPTEEKRRKQVTSCKRFSVKPRQDQIRLDQIRVRVLLDRKLTISGRRFSHFIMNFVENLLHDVIQATHSRENKLLYQKVCLAFFLAYFLSISWSMYCMPGGGRSEKKTYLL